MRVLIIVSYVPVQLVSLEQTVREVGYNENQSRIFLKIDFPAQFVLICLIISNFEVSKFLFYFNSIGDFSKIR